ncbi:MAG: hypothetical protein FWF22_09790, partial [Treponema sp.]|nr:hypothetical protein [Treponema sp.]
MFRVFSGTKYGDLSEKNYIVLSVDKEIEDSVVADKLHAAGIDKFYSESATDVYFDDFGKWKVFPLDQFRD